MQLPVVYWPTGCLALAKISRHPELIDSTGVAIGGGGSGGLVAK